MNALNTDLATHLVRQKNFEWILKNRVFSFVWWCSCNDNFTNRTNKYLFLLLLLLLLHGNIMALFSFILLSSISRVYTLKIRTEGIDRSNIHTQTVKASNQQYCFFHSSWSFRFHDLVCWRIQFNQATNCQLFS